MRKNDAILCGPIAPPCVGQEFDPQGSTIHSVLIPDISCDKNFVAKLAERCTTGQLLAEQLCEVVYDALP